MSKTAIVTGGSRGIGRATAIELSKMGMNVAVIFHGNQEKADETVAACKANGVEAIAIKCDVKVMAEVQIAIENVMETFGSVDVLVNNAGVTKDGLLLRMSEEDFDAVVDTNLKGCFLFSKACAAIMMKQRSGKIINIASIVGLQGNAGQANYAASKAGIIGFTKSLAKELGSRGITVNAVAPGFVETDMTDVLSDKVKEAFLNMVPLKRTAKPEDIANAIGFLASEKADYITGQVLTVDGGMCM
jgi:3-oxoacyl-[acyl-carrier protein] reductase